MKTTDLKLFALEYINLQDNLSSSDKLQVMEFVSSATKEEVMSLLFTGIPRQLEEGEDRFVSELFKVSNIGGFLSESLVLTEGPNTDALKGVFDTALKGNKKALQWLMSPENKAAFKGMLDTAVKGNKEGAKALAKAVQGKGAVFGHSGFSKAMHGKEALGDSGAIKALASKWASFKVPNVKELPSWLGGGVVGKGESAAAWGNNYNQAIEALNKGVPVAAAVVAALVIMLSRKAYKAYFTKAARACKGTKGEQKNECIKKFKIDAVKAQIGVMNQAKAACKSAKDPGQCTAKIDQKIQKKQVEMQKLAAKKKVR